MEPDGADFMNIGEFGRRVGLSVSALRFYDECGLLKPTSVDPATGYRSYEHRQVPVAELVRDLRQLRLPVARVRELLLEGPEARHAAVEEQLDVFRREVALATRLATSLHAHIDELGGQAWAEVRGQDLAAALGHALSAAGRDDPRPGLNGVLFEAKGRSLRLVSTDRHRLTIRDLPTQSEPVFRVLVAARALAAAQSWIKGRTTIRVSSQSGQLVLSGDGSERIVPALDAPYPDYERLLEVQAADRVAIASVVAVADAIVRLPEQGPVVLTFGDGFVRLIASGTTHSVPARCPAESDVEVVLNARFVCDAVAGAVGPDLAIEASGPLEPVAFRSADSGTAVTLVMPIMPSETRWIEGDS